MILLSLPNPCQTEFILLRFEHPEFDQACLVQLALLYLSFLAFT